jgi:hypothetical protein
MEMIVGAGLVVLVLVVVGAVLLVRMRRAAAKSGTSRADD